MMRRSKKNGVVFIEIPYGNLAHFNFISVYKFIFSTTKLGDARTEMNFPAAELKRLF